MDEGTGSFGELHAVILAGGFGRRLEALTTRLFGAAIPKQFCRFAGQRSLLQQTLDRLAPLVPARRTTVVVDRSQVACAQAQLVTARGVHLVEQPCDRGTAAGVLLPLLHLAARAPNARVLLAASDHGIVDEAQFRRVLRQAAQSVATTPERLLLIGATPHAANRDYGWIVRGAPLETAPAISAVERFVEKPDGAMAEQLFASGRAWWNTMLLVATVDSLLRLFRSRLPDLTAAMEALCARSDTGTDAWRRDYGELQNHNFSADVIGTATSLGALALPAAVGWTDLGTEERLLAWLARDAPRMAEADAANAVAVASERNRSDGVGAVNGS